MVVNTLATPGWQEGGGAERELAGKGREIRYMARSTDEQNLQEQLRMPLGLSRAGSMSAENIREGFVDDDP